MKYLKVFINVPLFTATQGVKNNQIRKKISKYKSIPQNGKECVAKYPEKVIQNKGISELRTFQLQLML